MRRPGLSGGDRIFIELTRRWASKGIGMKIFVSESGYRMYARYVASDAATSSFTVTHRYTFDKPSTLRFLFFELHSIVAGLLSIMKREKQDVKIVFSASDFPGDCLPALLLKLFCKERTKWVATFWLFAPNPFSKTSPYKGLGKIRNLLYFMNQRFLYSFVRKYADIVWVTNELDRWKFIDCERLTPEKVTAVLGGVDIQTLALVPEPPEKNFDAVFIGRFHPQKGVLELIEIWKHVCEKKKGAKLAMIGNGDLENEVRKKIKKYGLENNVTLFGFKDGAEKLKIFKMSRVVVHPATYDSGGMAACEAMACGLPGVSFDLPALRTYYPKGMLKTPCYDLKAFAGNILLLLDNEEFHKEISEEASEYAGTWDWNKRSETLWEAIRTLISDY